MGINLIKGQNSVLSLLKFCVGLGWDPNESLSVDDFDLDVSAFMLDANKKLLTDEYLVFYNSDPLRVTSINLNKIEPQSESKYPSYTEKDNKGIDKLVSSYEHWRRKTRPVDPEFSVIGSIDDMDGNTSAGGDDETMDIDLSKVNPLIEEIIITVTIDKFKERKQNFGQVDDSYVRIYNPTTKEELYKYELSEDFSTSTAIEFCRLYKKGNEWKVQALGIGHCNGIEELVKKYN
jgi:tellurium resistance protein TerD